MTEAMNDPRLLSARAAAARLGVKLETLYAYVSRGLIEPRRRAGRRESLFAAEDVERLRAGGRRAEPAPATASFAAALWERLADTRPSAAQLDLLNAALVLLADHELAASALAARIAASVRAHPYAVVSAGLGAIQGPLHGASSLWVEDVFAEAESYGGAE